MVASNTITHTSPYHRTNQILPCSSYSRLVCEYKPDGFISWVNFKCLYVISLGHDGWIDVHQDQKGHHGDNDT